MRSLVQLLAVIAAFGTDAIVRAQDEGQVEAWPRFHFGVAVGQSQLGPDMSEAGVPEHRWGNRSLDSGRGRKVVAGFRPLRVVGVEIQSVDFGDADVSARAGRYDYGQISGWDQRSDMKASSDGQMLAALLFIPEASPWLDVYAKVGVAHIEESLTTSAYDRLTPDCQIEAWYVPPPPLRPPSFCSFESEIDRSESAPYLGFGARFKIARAAGVRIEYEAVDRDGGDPTTLLSVGIAWEH